MDKSLFQRASEHYNKLAQEALRQKLEAVEGTEEPSNLPSAEQILPPPVQSEELPEEVPEEQNSFQNIVPEEDRGPASIRKPQPQDPVGLDMFRSYVGNLMKINSGLDRLYGEQEKYQKLFETTKDPTGRHLFQRLLDGVQKNIDQHEKVRDHLQQNKNEIFQELRNKGVLEVASAAK